MERYQIGMPVVRFVDENPYQAQADNASKLKAYSNAVQVVDQYLSKQLVVGEKIERGMPWTE
ncbi:hypothetical protein [Vibrio navarrensis]|uniref:Uncharacterized protein n=1 Tax=Vibrio navarrensis TaxID=29495 RepID=A0AAJ4LVG3_9VIBR|nr:hypothetical protein I3X05_06600 [Vibrio navarrensis]